MHQLGAASPLSRQPGVRQAGRLIHPGNCNVMTSEQLEDLARRLAAVMPPALGPIRREIEDNLRSVLSSQLPRFDLVSRDEFEATRAVLQRTRERLDALEAELHELEREPVK